MTIKDLIQRLQDAVEHGQDPEAEVMAWDPDTEKWEPVTVLTLGKQVRIYTDEP